MNKLKFSQGKIDKLKNLFDNSNSYLKKYRPEKLYDAKDYDYDIEWGTELVFKSLKVSMKIGNNKYKDIGMYRNLTKEMRDCMTLKASIGSNLKFAIFAATQCTVPENSSSSPSMILHQIAAISLGISIDANVQWEESRFNYIPDLLVEDKNDNLIYIDIKAKKTDDILHNREKIPIIIINKYDLLPCSGVLEMIMKHSKSNDSRSSEIIYDTILKQAGEYTMLYSRRMIDLFLKRSTRYFNIEKLSEFADEAYKDYLRGTHLDFKEYGENDLYNDINEHLERVEKILIDDEKILENKYYCFPFYRTSDMDKMTVKKKDIIKAVEHKVDGVLLIDHDTNKELFYDKVSEILVTKKTKDELRKYPLDKMEKREQLLEVYKLVRLESRSHDDAFMKLLNGRIFQHLGINCFDHLKNRVNKSQSGFVETIRYNMKEYDFKSFYHDLNMGIDPDHLRLINDSGNKKIIDVLARNRDYQELRFKAKISQAITYLKKSGGTAEVKHWHNTRMVAVFKICGLILEKDKGVVYVSYFDCDSLTRTEKWRLTDVENYSVNHHRMLNIVLAFVNDVKLIDLRFISLVGRILNENSWGLSVYLKVFRYLASGICMNSNLIKKTLDKLEGQINNSVKSKLSFRYMMHLLRTNLNSHSIKFGNTPLFNLPFKHLGWEIFLCNLCPNATYGKNRHLYKVSNELADEIDLYDANFHKVKEIYKDFEDILDIKEEFIVKRRMLAHFNRIRDLDKRTETRFTFSPIMMLLIDKVLQRKKYNYRLFQGSVPKISDLMTAKASTSSLDSSPKLAVQSIFELTKVYNTASTSLLALNILSKNNKVDLTMRIFDKDQIGGDREISILSAEFRILQSIVEKFFEKWASQNSIDQLHNPNKINNLIRHFEYHIKSEHSIFLTADQTRWGPNLNTNIFGFLSLLISNNTTEYYLPALISFMSEFKLFEMPAWIVDSLFRSTDCYTTFGKVGRSHMGQGIFHQSSSLYHSLVTEYYLDFFLAIKIPEEIKEVIRIESSGVVTSDDIASMVSIRVVKDIKEEEKKQFSNQIKDLSNICMDLLVNYQSFIMPFGIKTSNYKNIISENELEFNSIYLSKKSIANIDIKFLYSLIEPSTTGNFIFDLYNIYDTYVKARNSLMTDYSSILTCKVLLVKLCRQWKIDFSQINIPKDSDIRAGIPKVHTVDKTSMSDFVYFKVPTTLRFKTRRAFEQNYSTGDEFLDLMVKDALDKISHSRERTNYRSILTYSKDNILAIDTPYFQNFDIIGISYTILLKNIIDDRDYIFKIINRKYEEAYTCYEEEYNSQADLFKLITIRESFTNVLNLNSMLVSHYPVQKYLSTDLTKINLHFLRKTPRLSLNRKLFDNEKTDILEAINIINDEIFDLIAPSSNCRVIEHDPESKIRTYKKFVYYPPKSLEFVKFHYSMSKIVDKHKVDWSKNWHSSYLNKVNILKLTDDYSFKTINLETSLAIPFIDVKVIELNSDELIDFSTFDFKRFMNMEFNYRYSLKQEVYMNLKVTSPEIKLLSKETDSKVSELTAEEKEELINSLNLNEINVMSNDINIDESKDLMSGINIDLEASKSERIKNISLKVRSIYGIFINSTWSLKAIVKFQFLRKAVEEEIIVYRSECKNISDFFLNDFYTLTNDFVKTSERIIKHCISQIRNEHVSLSKHEHLTALLKIVDGEDLSSREIVGLLNSEVIQVNFSTLAEGEVVELFDFANELEKSFRI